MGKISNRKSLALDVYVIFWYDHALAIYRNDRRMALIQMASTEEAVAALIVSYLESILLWLCGYSQIDPLSLKAMHNYKISESNHLRVSFSKNPISWSTLFVRTLYIENGCSVHVIYSKLMRVLSCTYSTVFSFRSSILVSFCMALKINKCYIIFSSLFFYKK